MKILDLFSGIGGFSIGLEDAGFETVAFCEIEDYPRAVLRKHWPNTPIYRDVRQLTGDQLRADGVFPNVIVGGYPCQPFSHAGVRRGAEDDRHLWPEVYRLVKEIRPAWGIFENVAGHISMGLDEVLSDLEAEDYAARPFVIPACALNAPHRRDRVWIVARNLGNTTGKLCNGDANANNKKVLSKVKLSSSIQPRRPSLSKDGVGWGFEAEPNVGRVANGVSRTTHRLKALGNAVVPQIPEIIGLTILRFEGAKNEVIK